MVAQNAIKEILGKAMYGVCSRFSNALEGRDECYGDEFPIMELQRGICSQVAEFYSSTSSFRFCRSTKTEHAQLNRSCWLHSIEIHFGNGAQPVLPRVHRGPKIGLLRNFKLVWPLLLLIKCLPCCNLFLYVL